MTEPAEAAPWPEPAALPLLPPLALAAYIACVAGAGALANCSLLAALLKSTTRGLFSLLLQLTIADIALGASISSEIWSNNLKNWIFGSAGCIAHRGLSVFASAASSYLVATIALHTLATANLEEKSIVRRIRRNHDEDEEIKSSRHSLVASSDSSTPPRTMNVDYKLSTSRVPITQPSIFVWILAISLSVPDFTLATTVQLDQNTTLCTIVDSGQRLHLYSILALVNLFLPAMIMCAISSLVLIKLKSKRLILSQIEHSETLSALKLSLCLIVVYFALCIPRSVMTTYNIYTRSMIFSETSLLQSVYQNDTYTTLGFILSSVYLGSILIRPLLCIFMLPSVRKAFSYGYTAADNV